MTTGLHAIRRRGIVGKSEIADIKKKEWGAACTRKWMLDQKKVE